MLTFNILEYVETLIASGFTEKQAKAQAKALSKISWSPDVATKIDVSELKSELKGDISDLKVNISELKSELKIHISELKSELKIHISELKSELKIHITDKQTEFIQWNFYMNLFIIFIITILFSIE